MKRSFLLLCAVLLVLGCALPLCCLPPCPHGPCAEHRSRPQPKLPLPSSEEGSGSGHRSPADTADDRLLHGFRSPTGQAVELSRCGSISSARLPPKCRSAGRTRPSRHRRWPPTATPCTAGTMQHRRQNGAWFTADPARRQGCLTDAVLHSYWGTAYEANYARLSALVDAVDRRRCCIYEDAPAWASYFAMSNGRTEASENVWGTALPYLVPVDSSTDTAADHYEYTLTLSARTRSQQLAGRTAGHRR